MAQLQWDTAGNRFYEAGVKKVVLYTNNPSPEQGQSGLYKIATAWNGVTNVTEKPSGAESTPLYANDSKYLSLTSAEEFGASIEAYTYPDAFAECDGSADLVVGVSLGQQIRKAFGLCYRTTIGNDEAGETYGYKLHLVYGLKAQPSEKAYATINNDPEAATFSWELTSDPVNVTGFKPTSIITIDSTKVNATKLAALEAVLYGTDAVSPASATNGYLPLPDEVATLMAE